MKTSMEVMIMELEVNKGKNSGVLHSYEHDDSWEFPLQEDDKPPRHL